MFRPLRWLWGTPQGCVGLAWGWGPSSSSPGRAVPCLWLAPRSPQLSAPSSQPPAPQQPHWGGQGEACWASPVGSCTPSAGTSCPKQCVNVLHPFALSAQRVQVLMEQENVGTSLAGRAIPAVSVWLRNESVWVCSWYSFLLVFARAVGSFSLAEKCPDVYKRLTHCCWGYQNGAIQPAAATGRAGHRQSSSTEPGSRFVGLKATSSAVPAARECTLSINQQSIKLLRAV